MFPSRFGPLYTAQDKEVLEAGSLLADQLELHLYPGRQPGPVPDPQAGLCNAAGQVIGMAGISCDLPAAQAAHPAYQKLAAVDEHIRQHYAQPISLAELTAIAGLSVAQLERHCKRIFQLTPRQMIHKARLGAASQLLLGELPITEIALRLAVTPTTAPSAASSRPSPACPPASTATPTASADGSPMAPRVFRLGASHHTHAWFCNTEQSRKEPISLSSTAASARQGRRGAGWATHRGCSRAIRHSPC